MEPSPTCIFSTSPLRVTLNQILVFFSNVTSPMIDALDADDNYIKFRWELASPFTPEPGIMPTMTITFDISGSLNFNGTCGGSAGTTNGITPGAPVITNSFN